MIYEPSEDSFLVVKHISKYAKGKILEIGTGSGIIANECSKYSNNIIATDINKESINYCKNKYKELKNIKFIVSDLFSNAKLKNKKFDLIIFNPPYLPEEEMEDEEAKLINSGGKEGNEIIIKFLENAKNYLNPDGKIILLYSSLTPNMKNIIIKLGYKEEIIDEEKMFFEKLFLSLLSKN